MRISDWSSDVCSSDLIPAPPCCHPHHITTERETMLDWIADPNIWASLLTLTFLEIVLGIDNIIFLSIITDRFAENRRVLAQRLGLDRKNVVEGKRVSVRVAICGRRIIKTNKNN